MKGRIAMETKLNNVKEMAKEKTSGFRAWCRKHKKALVTAGFVVGGVILTAVVGSRKTSKNDDTSIDVLPDSVDDAEPDEDDKTYVMEFFDQETGERYGDRGVLCGKGFADDFLDCKECTVELEKGPTE
jgi:hypothetical protein